MPVTGELRLDRHEAGRMSCEGCGAGGLGFVAFEHPARRSRRGLAYGCACLDAVEL